MLTTAKRGEIMDQKTTIRTFQPGDLPAMVTLINEADAVDAVERATTLQEMEHERSFPNVRAETDWFLAWRGKQLVGYTSLYVRPGNARTGSTIHCWGVVHPQWRRRGVGHRLLEAAYSRSVEYRAEIVEGAIHFQCNARDTEEDRRALFRSFGLEPVRYFVNMARPLNGNLPTVRVPAGIHLRIFNPEQDAATVWRVDNAAFRDHWGYTEGRLEEFLHWMDKPHLRPELWFLAEVEESGQVVGIGLNLIDPDWIAQTGRQEGYVDTLAVLPEHRSRGLGTALLVQSLNALQEAGMEAAHLHADAENLTGAVRLYERAGFRVRKTSIAYQREVGGSEDTQRTKVETLSVTP
jgi:mycothiol synthase